MEGELKFYESGEDYAVYYNKDLYLVIDEQYNDRSHYFVFDTVEEMRQYLRGNK